jgi:hypothetical protein
MCYHENDMKEKNKLLTRQEIESRLCRRAKKLREEIKKMEEGSRPTQATMNLPFHPPGACSNH